MKTPCHHEWKLHRVLANTSKVFRPEYRCVCCGAYKAESYFRKVSR